MLRLRTPTTKFTQPWRCARVDSCFKAMSNDPEKHVLCEKAFAINSNEASEMFDCAEKHDVFLMEGLWTRFFPAAKAIHEKIQSNHIGQVKNVSASFGFEVNDPTVKRRVIDPLLGGGALLDVGVYAIQWVLLAFDRTASILDDLT